MSFVPTPKVFGLAALSDATAHPRQQGSLDGTPVPFWRKYSGSLVATVWAGKKGAGISPHMSAYQLGDGGQQDVAMMGMRDRYTCERIWCRSRRQA